MHVKVDAEEKKQVHVHYVSTPVPFVVEEYYAGYYHIDDDDMAQVLQDQETVYWSSQRNSSIDEPRIPSAAITRPSQDQSQGREQQNQSETITVQSQLSIDEALARSLQLDDELSSISVNRRTVTGPDSSSSGSSSRSGEGSSTGSAAQAVQDDDDVDPDNMTYEELQTLTDAVGTESKGLTEELISYLPTSTYKIGLFSKKNRCEECVICQMAYEHRDKLMNLPCQHQYHSTCITHWLKINKACPICNKEVFGS